MAILAPDTPDYADRPTAPINFLLAALTELGYVDGQNVTFEFRFADHALERLPALAAELVAGQPDVLYTGAQPTPERIFELLAEYRLPSASGVGVRAEGRAGLVGHR